nr:unnamed protein product [Callosobruchus chinensis]
MYCYIKYITHVEFLVLEENEYLEDQLKENRILVVNPDCMVGVLLDYIFNEAKINKSIKHDFDLCTEKGKVLGLHSYPPETNASDMLKDKAIYYIVYSENNELKPLLSRLSQESMNFAYRQRKKKRLSGRSIGSMTSTSSPRSRRASAQNSKMKQWSLPKIN